MRQLAVTGWVVALAYVIGDDDRDQRLARIALDDHAQAVGQPALLHRLDEARPAPQRQTRR